MVNAPNRVSQAEVVVPFTSPLTFALQPLYLTRKERRAKYIDYIAFRDRPGDRILRHGCSLVCVPFAIVAVHVAILDAGAHSTTAMLSLLTHCYVISPRLVLLSHCMHADGLRWVLVG